MKKIAIILSVSLFVFMSCTQDEGTIIFPAETKLGTKKVDICHFDEDTGEYHTINVSVRAIDAHLAHGDILGDCNDNLICHWEDPVNNIWETILVKDEDLQEHLDHGDFLGSCGSNPGEGFTYIPDENFELALINLGIDSDGLINKRVLTTDISGLTTLNITGMNINDLTGIQDFENIAFLNFSNNQLTNVDLSKNIGLRFLRANGNQIVNIDLSNNTDLRQLFCYDNELISLDLSNNPNLSWIYCYNNNLENLNIRNGNNFGIDRFYAWSNPNLTFITVDDPTSANLGFEPYTTDKWRIDTNTTYN